MSGSTEAHRAPTLTQDLLRGIDEDLATTDELLRTRYPGERDVRQPVHTVYVPADTYTPDLPQRWGRQAVEAVEEHGGLVRLAQQVLDGSRRGPGLIAAPERAGADGADGADDGSAEAERLADAVDRKLRTEPVEDLRIDFEDGFGDRSDEEEDHWARTAAEYAARGLAAEAAPGSIGIRFKSMEAQTRRRGLRTLDLFLSTLLHASGGLPEQLVLTLPKVSTPDQVAAMVTACRGLEQGHGLPEGTLGFEIQVETPQLILGADGTVPLGPALDAGEGRVTSLHYGTYDYSASLGIAAAYQGMDHPGADFAKHQMMLAVAGTGVHVSDGSTNILPVGEPDAVAAAWDLHARLVRRHLQHGIHQGWDLHPHQLPTRFLATFCFFRGGFDSAARRLRSYVRREDSAVLDEPATAKALARYLERALACGAVTGAEVESAAGFAPEGLRGLARTGRMDDGDAIG
ncbi:HpcH/HpaI aldolase/citrate lyase family protein [Nesterenkonia marinintestina]|uniref:HpcH/HpaI aldolase/citrate lyase family protein n=1 Tax=Nesterenkonia marinintestina TaxID=2979865 RepID=UPI0021BE845F|nr:HpcH/HpaI aldolase/citrate lyase family protein [Nesterenkonia sp. GX14115]